MITRSISTILSTELLTYTPDGPPVSFEVTVHNDSDRFASFQLDLAAAGTDGKAAHTWYRVAPAISSKIPAGDHTRFRIDIVAIPPVPGGFTGTMNLTVRVFSLDLRDEDRQVLRLIIAGTGMVPPHLNLTSTQLQGYPNSLIDLPVRVRNQNRQAVDVTLRVSGIPNGWWRDGYEKHLHILAGEELVQPFYCQLPQPTQAAAGTYPLQIEALQTNTAATTAQAQLTVLPMGYVQMEAEPQRLSLPPQPGRWRNPRESTAAYTLAFTNASNRPHTIHIDAAYVRERENLDSPLVEGDDEDESLELPRPHWLMLPSEQATAEIGATRTIPLKVHRRLPWLGWSRLKRLRVVSALEDREIDFRQESQTLELQVYPVIAFWLQLLVAGAGFLLLLLGLWLKAHQGHSAPVNSVQFNGQGSNAVSASDDQTIRQWAIKAGDLIPVRVLDTLDKAVRVVRYRPFNNNQVWAGLEDGTIKGWDLLSNNTYQLVYQQDDRVLDLAIRRDGQTLYSGHGSGLVLQWSIAPEDLAVATSQPEKAYRVDFAVQALQLLGSDQQHLAIAGRYDRLVLLDLQNQKFQSINILPGTAQDYISSLASPADKPGLLAAADNQGNVKIWNWQSCLGNGACQPIDEWGTAHGGSPVRSVAFSDDGCFLASGGEDGKVMLWPLTGQGNRQVDWQGGKGILQASQPINSVDLVQNRQWLTVLRGGDDNRVRLRRLKVPNPRLPPGECAPYK